jgi:SNF2 family DNA or RNA helicase
MITKYQNQMRKEKAPAKIKKIAAKIHTLLAKNDDGMSVAKKFLGSSLRTMMVIDESTIIANHKSTISELCNVLKPYTVYRRILTGDPIPNEPINIYNQMDWLDSTTVKNRNFYAFRNRYCIMGGFKNKQIVGYKNEKELSNILTTYGHRARTVDVLDMPEQNWIVRDIEPSDKTLKLYNDVINNDIVPLFEGKDTISATMALSKLIKLEQICGGTLKGDNEKTHIIGNEKVQELLQMMKEFGNSSVLIWCHFRAEVDMLKDKLKGYVVDTYHGNLSSDERQCVVDRFENKQTQVLVVQDDTGHLGITLNAATQSVFYSNHRRPIVRSQTERRNWRIGQKFPVFYYDLLMGLVDTAGYESLFKKRKRNYGITDRMTKDELFKIVRPNGNDSF